MASIPAYGDLTSTYQPSLLFSRLAILSLFFGIGLFNEAHSFTLFDKNVLFNDNKSSLLKLNNFNLDTAYELLANEREKDQPAYSSLCWLDPASSINVDDDNDNNNSTTADEMPLYPIGATYMPSKTTHLINNVKKRNIQMALDLEHFQDDRKKFCVVLSCIDTGRIATVGTVMSIVNIDIQKEPYEKDNIRRIKVTCRPEATVDIQHIMNPKASSWESKLRDSPEYLKAQVMYRTDMHTRTGNEDDIKNIILSVLDDYNTIRNLYLNGTGTQFLLPFAIEALEKGLPEWTKSNLVEDFWLSVEQWQTLCQTIRQCQLVMHSSDVNEIKIAAARAKDGYLNLPIHIEDLPKSARSEIQAMEGKAQENYIKIGMDPCLDFQVLLSLPNYEEKLKFLSTMISRERQRLESSSIINEPKGVYDEVSEQPRKGAWFDDSKWESHQPKNGAWFDDSVW
eukprot:CAMPEP_0194137160 /NCGR_PEP_ID=MMETSP0152-20130528/7086_1 /TAXON_ID=1049557 /ORGANISM="Thalassiothrix antarctica, Strain L6-D1" /LENGTH=452 /DNA_ID=CAMNT_0038834081 /DNA_START=11 /DNA_END=1366 /DNA_ORIENTATION=-